MKSKGGYSLDFSQFDKNLKKILEKTIPKLAEKGMYDAANAMLDDAIKKPPQAPFKKGDLWGSRIVDDVKATRNDISAKAGFNIEYAKKQHEAEPGQYNYTKTGAKQPGPKYLETKMHQFKKKYMETIAESIRRAK